MCEKTPTTVFIGGEGIQTDDRTRGKSESAVNRRRVNEQQEGSYAHMTGSADLGSLQTLSSDSDNKHLHVPVVTKWGEYPECMAQAEEE